MTLSCTGAFIGDFIEAISDSKQAAGMYVKILGRNDSMFPPIEFSNPRLNDVYNNLAIRAFIANNTEAAPNVEFGAQRLKQHRLFSGFTEEEIREFLELTCERSWGLFHEGLIVKICSYGKCSEDGIGRIPEHIRDHYMNEAQTNLSDFLLYYPRKVTSEATSHCLIFRHSQWAIKEFSDKYVTVDGFLNMPTMCLERPIGTTIDVHEALKSEGVDVELYDFFKTCTHGVLKSLLQKIIRVGARNINIFGSVYGAKSALLAVITVLLFDGKKTFIPSIRRHVSGTEAVTKRIIVTAIEDSCANVDDMLFVLQHAVFYSQGIELPVTKELYDAILNIAHDAYESSKYFAYANSAIPETLEINGFSYIAQMLSCIGSFEGDIKMCKIISSKFGETSDGVFQRPDLMYMQCAFDHHPFPGIAYFAFEMHGNSFAELYSKLWTLSSSYNWRKQQTYDVPNEIFTLQTRVMQFYHTKKIAVSDGIPSSFVYNADLDEILVNFIIDTGSGWKVCLVKKRPSVDEYVTEDDVDIIAFRTPSRTDIVFDANYIAKKRDIENSVYEHLTGARYNRTYPSNLRINNGFYYYDGQKLTRQRKYNYFETERTINPLTEKANLSIGGGPSKPPSNECIQRLRHYCKKPTNRIVLNPLNRDGTGVYGKECFADLELARFLYDLCCTHSCVIELQGFGTYSIKNTNMFISIISPYLQDAAITGIQFDFELPYARLFDYQENAVSAMCRSDMKKHILFMETGSGKTITALEYLRCLGVLPQYIIYTLPASAIETVAAELDKCKLPHATFKLTAPAKTDKRIYTKTLLPGIITLIEHDQLRRLDLDEVCKLDFVFIADEVHKMLSNVTLRTSAALTLARASNIMVAMSGTLVRDSNLEALTEWLKLTVNYAVSPRNIWIALAKMQTAFSTDRVAVRRDSVKVEITGTLAARYASVTPRSMGGNASKLNISESAKILYEVVTPKIANIAAAKGSAFIVAAGAGHALYIKDWLMRYSITESEIHVVTRDTPVYLPYGDISTVRYVIAPVTHAEGYTITKLNTMITSVYFSNASTRMQLEGRINRRCQKAPHIDIITVFAGYMGQVMERYDNVRNFIESIKSMFDVEIE